MSKHPPLRPPTLPPTELARVRRSSGRELWRSLEQLADTPEFRRWVEDEFPGGTSELASGVDRRQFLTVMAASFALAGLTSCGEAPDKIVPYVRQPEEIIPGKPLHFATAVTRSGYAQGAVVESHMGRPTKIEGNLDHPASLGATDTFTQAATLGLYDPDRSQAVVGPDGISDWDTLERELARRLDGVRAGRGHGLHLLTANLTSPTALGLLDDFRATFPAASWHVYEPLDTGHALDGATIAFGAPAETVPHLDRADVIVAFDCDFMHGQPGSVRLARDFADRRRARVGELVAASMNRLYVAEPSPTVTGANADHRLQVRRTGVPELARALAVAVGVEVPASASLDPRLARWVTAVAADLKAHRGAGLVLVGEAQPPAVHALAHAINAALGNLGRTLVAVEPFSAAGRGTGSLVGLTRAIRAGEVDTLVMVDVNPAYDAPADVRFVEALAKVPFAIHFGLYRDETARLARWHAPLAHDLESWGDARAFDGTVTAMQPLIAPLYQGRPLVEVLALLVGETLATSRDLVEGHWRVHAARSGFDSFWKESLQRGVLDVGTATKREVTVSLERVRSALSDLPSDPPGDRALELVFTPDPTVYDGRYANLGWMQELPKQISGIGWDNAALVSPADAERLGLSSGQVVELQCGENRVEAAAWIVPGQTPGCVAASFGYGRTHAGRVGDGHGFNAYLLRTTDRPWVDARLQVRPTDRRVTLASRQSHQVLEGRDMYRGGTLAEFLRDPAAVAKRAEHDETLGSMYPGFQYKGQQWGMVVDLTACIGCGACTLACQAENNIPVVGKQQVIDGREMHWIRVDRYFQGPTDDPGIVHQPVPCMQCENAPCEVVCPVGATVHSHDGLNDMVYNRCIGTRYCSNNCPYKVRRFNFYRFSDNTTGILKMLRNPNVTVRGRGVMEKCTYCVQRIRAAEITARKESRPIREGEIVTACQQVCPVRAITFGDINDPTSEVARLKLQPHNYKMLRELNTRPRTSYLAAVRNPNPALADGDEG